MPKLSKKYQFLDLSDYGRSAARWIANLLKTTSYTPIHITSWFILSGILAIFCIIYDQPIAAAFFLILKSVLDAADGELARIKQTPSYVGRYYDSIADILLNFCFLLSFWYITEGSFFLMILAFIGIQLQGTLYNYYYVILRNNVNGDTTSRIFEDSVPVAMKGESQQLVNIFYRIYDTLYIAFDKIIYYMDREAIECQPFPSWFMTILSTFGLGFQLLIMAVLLVFNMQELVIPFFIVYSILILVFVAMRRLILN
jgi:phosphatidylglycerophosphate synthase